MLLNKQQQSDLDALESYDDTLGELFESFNEQKESLEDIDIQSLLEEQYNQIKHVKIKTKPKPKRCKVITCVLDEMYLEDWNKSITSMPPIEEMGQQFQWDKLIEKPLSINIEYKPLN